MVEADSSSLLLANARSQRGPSLMLVLAVEVHDELSGEREQSVARLTNDPLLHIVDPPRPVCG